MATELVFRTPPGGVNISVEEATKLKSIIVDRYRQIRVVADERRGSASDVAIRLTITEGDDLVAQLDVLDLTPGLEVTKVYDVPGIKLTVFAAATGKGDAPSTVDVLIYGFASAPQDVNGEERCQVAPAGFLASLCQSWRCLRSKRRKYDVRVRAAD